SSSSPRMWVAPSFGKPRGLESVLDSAWRCMLVGEAGSASNCNQRNYPSSQNEQGGGQESIAKTSFYRCTIVAVCDSTQSRVVRVHRIDHPVRRRVRVEVTSSAKTQVLLAD